MSIRRFVVPGVVVVFLMFLLLFVQWGGEDASAPSLADGVTEVVRQQLATAHPETATGQLLELTRVIVPAHESLPPHTHPGPQLAIIVSGTLTYIVIDGEVTVTRAASTAGETVETYASGDTLELQEGDSISEPALMVHRAAVAGDEPVIIYLASLFPEGAAPATTVQ